MLANFLIIFKLAIFQGFYNFTMRWLFSIALANFCAIMSSFFFIFKFALFHCVGKFLCHHVSNFFVYFQIDNYPWHWLFSIVLANFCAIISANSFFHLLIGTFRSCWPFSNTLAIFQCIGNFLSCWQILMPSCQQLFCSFSHCQFFIDLAIIQWVGNFQSYWQIFGPSYQHFIIIKLSIFHCIGYFPMHLLFFITFGNFGIGNFSSWQISMPSSQHIVLASFYANILAFFFQFFFLQNSFQFYVFSWNTCPLTMSWKLHNIFTLCIPFIFVKQLCLSGRSRTGSVLV